MSEAHAASKMSDLRRRPASLKPRKIETAARAAKIVGESLRDIRRRQGHSLDTLALESGVSRAMLGQIETGKSVPTITVLWKIADALGVPVAQLIADPDAPLFQVVRKAESPAVSTGSGQFETRLLAPNDDPSELSFSEKRIAPGHREQLSARRWRGRISLVVGRGAVEITVAEQAAVALSEGDAILFSAALAHVIANCTSEASTLYLVAAPQRNGRG
jgi:transcriptional regulator with XRE-family HTH domain